MLLPSNLCLCAKMKDAIYSILRSLRGQPRSLYYCLSFCLSLSFSRSRILSHYLSLSLTHVLSLIFSLSLIVSPNYLSHILYISLSLCLWRQSLWQWVSRFRTNQHGSHWLEWNIDNRTTLVYVLRWLVRQLESWMIRDLSGPPPLLCAYPLLPFPLRDHWSMESASLFTINTLLNV